jgi:hypothetical protein
LILCGLLIGCSGSESTDGCGIKPKDDFSAAASEAVSFAVQRIDQGFRQANQAKKENPLLTNEQLFAAHLATYREHIIHWIFEGDETVPDSLICRELLDFVLDTIKTRELFDSVHAHYPANYPFNEKLGPAFARLRHYFPQLRPQKVFCYVNGYTRPAVEHMDPIFPPIDSEYVGVGLHYFLGAHFKYYPAEIPMWIRRRLTAAHIPVWIMREYAAILQKKILSQQERPPLIHYMVDAGVRLYFLDKILPDTPDSLKIFYTGPQLEWACTFIKDIYNELLQDFYTQEFKRFDKYVRDRPFTPNLDRDSPPRLGEFLGWQIVRSYMAKHPEISLQALLHETDLDKIFKESGFKP